MAPRPAAPPGPIIAVDPGRGKCGLAVLSEGEVAFRAIVPTPEIGLTCRYLAQRHPNATLVVGQGTGGGPVTALLQKACPEVPLTGIAERGSTLEARELYWADNPPRGLQRLLPRGMRVPPRPVDDYAAVVLAQRHLAATSAQ
jgi:hypothetical protein